MVKAIILDDGYPCRKIVLKFGRNYKCISLTYFLNSLCKRHDSDYQVRTAHIEDIKSEVNNSLSDLLRAVVKEKEKDSSFKRVDGTEYYFITDDECIEVEEEENDYTDDMHHKIGNYCSDIGLLRQRNLHETLNRLLWRFSLENGGDSEWDGVECHWYITFQEGLVKRS